ncbi:MAG: XdhC family protein [Oligoflexales bacterium]|nr:XdhC family protein [Oligoflexales bacterium]
MLSSCKAKDLLHGSKPTGRLDSLGEAYVLATVVKTEGSTYQKIGAQMLVHQDGSQEGILSGACAESQILELAQTVLKTRKNTLLDIDSSSAEDILFGYGMGCQGKQTILLEYVDTPEKQSHLECEEKHLIALIYSSPSEKDLGKRLIISQKGILFSNLDSELLESIATQAQDAFRLERTEAVTLCYGDKSLGLSFIFRRPKPSLHIFGAGADAYALSSLAHWMGWSVQVYEHRSSHVHAHLWEYAQVHSCYDIHLPSHSDTFQAVILMTHNFIIDLMIIEKVVCLPLHYLGLMGPRHRGDLLLSELKKNGLKIPEKILHSPVGLSLGGRSPQEISTSIIAQIQSIFFNTGLGR